MPEHKCYSGGQSFGFSKKSIHYVSLFFFVLALLSYFALIFCPQFYKTSCWYRIFVFFNSREFHLMIISVHSLMVCGIIIFILYLKALPNTGHTPSNRLLSDLCVFTNLHL